MKYILLSLFLAVAAIGCGDKHRGHCHCVKSCPCHGNCKCGKGVNCSPECACK